jgi:uncharacterized protein with HEPN domain
MERDLQSLLDMLQSAQIVMNYIAGRSRDDLTTDLQFQDATIRRLLIIGEASKRVSETTRQALITIPWVAINGMRNRLVHEYDEIDLDILWDTAVNSLPTLIEELRKTVPFNE